MSRGAKMVMRENGAQCTVAAFAVVRAGWPETSLQRVRIPALDRRHGTFPALSRWRRAKGNGVTIGRGWVFGDRACKVDRRGRLAVVLIANCVNAVHYFIGAQAPILVVIAIGRAVRGKHIELHQMDVLPENVSGRADLEVI